MEGYAKLYNTNGEFHDLYMAEKAWLIGTDIIVQVISIGGFDDITALALNADARVEHSVYENCALVTVYDKTGQAISLMVCPEDALTLAELLK